MFICRLYFNYRHDGQTVISDDDIAVPLPGTEGCRPLSRIGSCGRSWILVIFSKYANRRSFSEY